MAGYTVFLSEPEAVEVDTVGKEARQLHLLMENAVRVSDGFVVTAPTLGDFLDQSGAGEKIDHLLSARVKDDQGLDILSRQAVETVMAADMSWDIESDIIGAYERLARQQEVGSPRVSVAVSVAFHPERFPYFANTFERRAATHDRHDLDKAIKEAWASVFAPESLRYYRSIGWDLKDVRASVLVQHGIAPEASGVAVAVPDDEGGHDLVVKAVLGSAMALERDLVEPDTYLVDLQSGEVLDRDMHPQDEFFYPDEGGRMRPLRLPPDLANQPKVPDETCAELARLSRLAMKVFGEPMVLEWALVGEGVWVVDAIPLSAIEDMSEGEEQTAMVAPTPRPSAEPAPVVETAPAATYEEHEDAEVEAVLQAMGFSPKRRRTPKPAAAPEPLPEPVPAPGPGPEEGPEPPPETGTGPGLEVEPGPEEGPEPAPETGTGPGPEVEPVPEEGPEPAQGPGTEPGPGDGSEPEQAPSVDETALAVEHGRELLSPEQLDPGPYLPITEMQVLVSTEDVAVIKELPGVPVTGIRFDDGRYLVSATGGVHPLRALQEDEDGTVEVLAAGQVAMAQASFPSPVYVQLTDLRADVFGELEGGEDLEDTGCMAAMGFRGVARLISQGGEPLLRAEARAIRKARRDLHMTNLHVVIPFPRTVDEVESLYNILFEEGVRRTGNLRVYIDVAVPSTLLFLHLYSQVSDGFFIRLDELLPALLSIDPGSKDLEDSPYLTAHEKAVRQAILLVTEAAHQAKKEVIIETRKTLDPGLVEFLLRIGINGICLTPEGLRENVALVSQVEQDLQGEGAQ